MQQDYVWSCALLGAFFILVSWLANGRAGRTYVTSSTYFHLFVASACSFPAHYTPKIALLFWPTLCRDENRGTFSISGLLYADIMQEIQ